MPTGPRDGEPDETNITLNDLVERFIVVGEWSNKAEVNSTGLTVSGAIDATSACIKDMEKYLKRLRRIKYEMA